MWSFVYKWQDHETKRNTNNDTTSILVLQFIDKTIRRKRNTPNNTNLPTNNKYPLSFMQQQRLTCYPGVLSNAALAGLTTQQMRRTCFVQLPHYIDIVLTLRKKNFARNCFASQFYC